MKPSQSLNHAAKVLISLTLLFACPLLLPAQSKDKKSNPPPPPPQQQRQQQQPPPQQHPVQQPQQQHPGQPQQQHPGQTQQHPGQQQHGSTVTKTPDGRTVERKSDGSSVERDKSNRVTARTTHEGHKIEYNQTGQLSKVVTRSGSEAHFNARGKVSTIKTANGTTIMHGLGGQRQVVTEHRDASGHLQNRAVSSGPSRGYVEHSFQRGGHEYVRRTYVYQGHTSVYVYRNYYYRGAPYYYYVPAYYYAPVYYGWAYNTWSAPVYYTWGWYGDPWYQPYGYYFAPYPSYPSAAFWLTDYLIAENLRAAYEAQAVANANEAAANADEVAVQPGSQSGAVTLTPEVKQMIAEEVKAQLAAEQAAATQNGTASRGSSPAPAQPAGNADQVPPALDPNLRVFIVTTSLDVTASGQGCSLSPGDVLRRMDNVPDSSNTVGVVVLSSKKSDCGIDSSPRIQVADLQDMHNHFREQLDNGLKTLADNQGKHGIPSGPASNPRQNPDGKAAEDLTAATDLQKQQQDAEQAEKEVQQASTGNGNGQ